MNNAGVPTEFAFVCRKILKENDWRDLCNHYEDLALTSALFPVSRVTEPGQCDWRDAPTDCVKGFTCGKR